MAISLIGTTSRDVYGLGRRVCEDCSMVRYQILLSHVTRYCLRHWDPSISAGNAIIQVNDANEESRTLQQMALLQIFFFSIPGQIITFGGGEGKIDRSIWMIEIENDLWICCPLPNVDNWRVAKREPIGDAIGG